MKNSRFTFSVFFIQNQFFTKKILSSSQSQNKKRLIKRISMLGWYKL